MNLSIGKKIGFGFGLVIFLALVNYYFTVNTINEHKKISSEVLEKHGPSVEILDKFHFLIIRSKMLILNWVFIQSPDHHPYKKQLREIINEDYPVMKRQIKLLSKGWNKENQLRANNILEKMDSLFNMHIIITNHLNSFHSYNDTAKTQTTKDFLTEEGEIEVLTSEIINEINIIYYEQQKQYEQADIELTISSDSLLSEISYTSIVLVFGGLFIGFIVVKSIVDPIKYLRNLILQVAKGKFPEYKVREKKDEIGEMTKALNILISGLKNTTRFSEEVGAGNFNSEFKPLSEDDMLGAALLKMRKNLEEHERNLEKNVEERTQELNQTKEALENSLKENEKKKTDFQALNAVGHEIGTSLDLETIIHTTYESINFLMGASAFGIGVYNKELQRLEFNGLIDKEEKVPFFYDYVDDKNSLAVWCFNNNKVLYIKDFKKEYKEFITSPETSDNKNQYATVIYLPLEIEDQVIGVATLQSAKVNAYSDYEFSLLTNLTYHIATALEKAKSYKIIEKKNRETNESLQYAKRIQTAILPRKESLEAVFPQSFIMYNPKELVSGDFYYFVQQDGKYILGALDCTGHGVPGGFMSMMGYSLLNQIVMTNGETNPSKILNLLDKEIVKGLRQDEEGSESKDGMDGIICSFDLANNKMEIAGAHNSLLIYNEDREEPITILKADRLSVGGLIDKEKEFTLHEIDIREGDSIYLFSDGFHDQFGGEKNRKYMGRRLRDFLASIQDRSLKQQKKELEKEFAMWKGDLSQVDDVMVIGIRLSPA